MKIAIIDDGINQNYFAQRIYQKVDFSSGVSQNGEDSRHGTICAQIIRQICGKIDIVDVKVLKNGTAHIRQFIKALKWCECNDIKLVHTIYFIFFRKSKFICKVFFVFDYTCA